MLTCYRICINKLSYNLKIRTEQFLLPYRAHSCPMEFKQHRMIIKPEVQNALKMQKPVVALESTLITHGMPYPENVKTALEVENIVRMNGAIPATIGIIDGYIRVGLTNEQLNQLAQKRQTLIKCSQRDLSYVVAFNRSGGTTVAATMVIANWVGIKIFATGGIGGVHQNGHVTMDISADLVELGRTPVVVICSGVKSILDIPRTLEYLETQGVYVASYNSPGGSFPDFFTCDSGCKVPYNLKDADDAALVISNWQSLGLNSGILIAVPIPKQYSADKKEIDIAILEANKEASLKRITGKDVTPFILKRIANSTGKRSLQANMALVKNNAAVAAQIASKLVAAQLNETKYISSNSNHIPIVVGASVLDMSFKIKNSDRDVKLNGGTYAAVAHQSAGGVGRNIAECILQFYGNVSFISAVGNDAFGKSLMQLMPKRLQSDLIIVDKRNTSVCSVIFDITGECKLLLGDMDIHQSITPEIIKSKRSIFHNSHIIVMDSNISIKTMEAILIEAKHNAIPVFFEPTDMFIADKPFNLPKDLTHYIRVLTPNIHELKTIVETITGIPMNWKPTLNIEQFQLLNETKKMVAQINTLFNCVIVTLGEHGIFISLRRDAVDDTQVLFNVSAPSPKHLMRFYAAPKVENIVNVSGAGDSFFAGFITALLRSRNIDDCVATGFLAAESALHSDSAVPNKLFDNIDNFDTKYIRGFDL